MNIKDLVLIFSAYGGRGYTGKQEFYMSPNEYVECIRDAGMINHLYTIRQAHFCASWSMQLVIDDVKFPVRAGAMTFVDFLECLCRSSEIFHIPTTKELTDSKCSNILEFYEMNLRRETKNIHKNTMRTKHIADIKINCFSYFLNVFKKKF